MYVCLSGWMCNKYGCMETIIDTTWSFQVLRNGLELHGRTDNSKLTLEIDTTCNRAQQFQNNSNVWAEHQQWKRTYKHTHTQMQDADQGTAIVCFCCCFFRCRGSNVYCLIHFLFSLFFFKCNQHNAKMCVCGCVRVFKEQTIILNNRIK